MIWLLYSSFHVAHAGCEEPTAVVDTAKQAIVEGRLDDAEQAIGDMEAALGCGPGASPELLARFWLAEGALLVFGGDLDAAADSFRAANRVQPGFWNPDLGPVVEKAYRAAIAQPEGDPGTIELKPPPETYVAVLDGKVTTYPAEAVSGLHLVEVGPPKGPMDFGRFVFVEPGQTLVLTTGVVEKSPEPEPEPVVVAPAPEPEPVAPAPLPPEPTKSPVFLATSGAAAALAIGAGALYLGQNSSLREAESLDDLNSAKSKQVLYSGAGFGLAGVAVVGLGLHFAL